MREMSVDFPTLGKPTRPTSASSFSSSQAALLAGLAFLGLPRGLVPGLGEVLVAAPAAPAQRHHAALARGGEVDELLAGLLVGDDRAHRDLQDQVGAGVPGAV